MIFIVGLGNPGEKYQDTRHNAGQFVLDNFAKKLSPQGRPAFGWKIKNDLRASIAKSDKLILARPETYMNESGQAVRAVLNYYADKNFDYKNLYIIHDDLDLELGNYKFQFGKGPKVHNGLLSIYQHLGTDQFWHVRIGVDNRQGDRSMPSDKYVLGKFSQAEKEKLNFLISDLNKKLLERIKTDAL